MITLEYELYNDMADIRGHIRECEGKHVQQAIYSTFMDTLTQVCFTCGTIRSTILWDGSTSYKPAKESK